MTETEQAQLDINIGVQSKKRREDERFRPTTVNTETFTYSAVLNEYLEETPTIAEEINSVVQNLKDNDWEVNAHFDVRLDNVTHVAVAKGVIPLPKGHRDAKMTHLELVSADAIEKFLNNIVADLKQKARY